MQIHIQTPEEMKQLGEKWVKHQSKFLLYGELGAGKTVLVKGIATGLHIDPQNVQSPTYTYLHIYEDKLLHIDMRRIETEKQFLDLGLGELMEKFEYIAIEWPKWECLYADKSRSVISLTHQGSSRLISQALFDPSLMK